MYNLICDVFESEIIIIIFIEMHPEKQCSRDLSSTYESANSDRKPADLWGGTSRCLPQGAALRGVSGSH